MNRLSAWFSLFTSTGTLLCCALPSLLVALGMGAAMAGLVTAVPQIVWLSQHKAWVFMGSGVMLSLSAYLQYRARFETCPIDPKQAEACKTGRKWSLRILIFSIVLWLTGAFFAFVAPRIM
ncbi:MAG: hypothetical protein HAW63_05680 [Bdellovibrionaceae bacterium]|nr:hypothetical protein [Pseudobdellovibrionaceae bacterium]